MSDDIIHVQVTLTREQLAAMIEHFECQIEDESAEVEQFILDTLPHRQKGPPEEIANDIESIATSIRLIGLKNDAFRAFLPDDHPYKVRKSS